MTDSSFDENRNEIDCSDETRKTSDCGVENRTESESATENASVTESDFGAADGFSDDSQHEDAWSNSTPLVFVKMCDETESDDHVCFANLFHLYDCLLSCFF